MNRSTTPKTWPILALVLPAIFLAVYPAYAQRGVPRPNPGIPGPPSPRVPGPNQPFMPGPNQPGVPGPNQPGNPWPNQPGMPGRPNNWQQPPSVPQQRTVWITVWTCSRCGQEVGRGDHQPSLANCPHCGANFNAVAPVARRTPEQTDDTAANLVMPLAIGLVMICLVTVGVFLVVKVSRRKAEPELEEYNWYKQQGPEVPP
jgi:hypothetical protein